MERLIHDNSFDHVQLTRGRFQANAMHASLGNSYLDSGSYNLPLLAQGKMSEQFIFLGSLLHADGRGYLNSHEVNEGTLAVMTENTEMHFTLAPNSHWLAFMIDRDMLESVDVFIPGHFTAPVQMSSNDRVLLRNRLRAMHDLLIEVEKGGDDISLQHAYLTNLEAELIDTFSSVLAVKPLNGLTGPMRLSKLAKKATDYMDAHLEQPMRIGQVVQAVGTSWRTLDRAFATQYGVTPKQFLQLLRLARARRLLLSGDESYTVTGIAARCGIYHLGRFAIAYRELYGELPMQTLKTGRARMEGFKICRT